MQKKNPRFWSGGFSFVKPFVKSKIKRLFFGFFIIVMENIFTIQERLNPLKYKENPTITRIVGLVRVAGVEPTNKWL